MRNKGCSHLLLVTLHRDKTSGKPSSPQHVSACPKLEIRHMFPADGCLAIRGISGPLCAPACQLPVSLLLYGDQTETSKSHHSPTLKDICGKSLGQWVQGTRFSNGGLYAALIVLLSISFFPPEFGVYCSHCRSEVRGTQCAICKGFTFQCAICHVAVRGSSNFCLTCGHGGHTSHMMEWFRTQEVCPTGCGCHCLLESTF